MHIEFLDGYYPV